MTQTFLRYRPETGEIVAAVTYSGSEPPAPPEGEAYFYPPPGHPALYRPSRWRVRGNELLQEAA